ncbi:MAG: hypothetical protein NC914_00930 [Candidatus Omnitrophica bacterium]|nr:hypothetical protein [Candidatus Omnitrophota bacterium]
MMKLKPYLRNLTFPVLALGLSLCASCSQRPTSTEPQNADELFLKSFRSTLKFDTPLYANARLAGSTLWIYIATEKEILTLDRSPQQKESQEKIFLEVKGEYSPDLNFKFYYSVYMIPKVPETAFKEEVSVTGVTENFTNTMQEITNKVYSSMADLIYSAGKELKFFVVVIADIKKGIEVKTSINRADLEKYIVGIIPAEQFHTRTLIKVKGDERIVNDKQGRHLNYKDISLTDFITELTTQQAKQEFAKLGDAGKNSLKAKDLILKALYKFSKIYEFDDFFRVETTDATLRETQSLTRYELMEKFKETQI